MMFAAGAAEHQTEDECAQSGIGHSTFVFGVSGESSPSIGSGTMMVRRIDRCFEMWLRRFSGTGRVILPNPRSRTAARAALFRSTPVQLPRARAGTGWRYSRAEALRPDPLRIGEMDWP